MSVQKRGKAYRVRWKEGDSWRSRTFDRKSDANVFDAELRRLRRLGALPRSMPGPKRSITT